MTKKNYLISSLILAGLVTSCAKDREYEEVYKGVGLLNKNAINTSVDFLYVPTSQGVPRFTKAMAPFVQGREKIIRFKFEEAGLVAYEMEKNPTFQDNTLNNKPILTIPMDYKSYRCAENSNDECTDREEENTELEWDQKNQIDPDFAALKIHEADSVGLPSNGDSCFSLVDTKVVSGSVKITDIDINFELEKTYKYSNSPSCQNDLWYNSDGYEDFLDSLDNGAFNTRLHISFARLDTVATPNYAAIDYPVSEHGVFGFFKTAEKVKNSNNQNAKAYKVNRWAPTRDVVEYHLSDEFAKPENAYLKEATIFAFDRMNKVLESTGVNLKLKLSMPSGKSPGNLRNTMVVLIEDIASGLLGYGPTVANPRTGEIIKGHVNMYKGSLESFAPYTYDSIVFLEQELKKSQNEVPALISNQSNNNGGTSANSGSQAQSSIGQVKGFMSPVAMATKTINKALNTTRRAKKFSLTSASKIFNPSKFMKNRNKKIEANVTKRLLAKFKDTDNIYYKNLANREGAKEIMRRNSVYTADMLNFQSLGKASVKDINQVSGIRDNDGALIPWIQLEADKKKEIIQILARHAYIPTLVHEIGHNLGLRHNFAGSVDKANFYTEEERHDLDIEGGSVYSSIMDYSYSGLNALSTFGNYDVAALKFAYNREVELTNGSFVKVEVVNKDNSVTRVNLNEIPGRKNYQFCTDQNAGSSLTCNRFDEGTDVSEIMNHYATKYKENYYWLNVKNRSRKFNDGMSMWSYTIRSFNTMNSVRQIHEQWQALHNNLSQYESVSNLSTEGCTPEQRVTYRKGTLCQYTDSLNKANTAAGRFYLDIIKTPNLTCDTSMTIKIEDRVLYSNIRMPFDMAESVEDMEFSLPGGIDTYKPHTCFDKNVAPFIANANIEKYMPGIIQTCLELGIAPKVCESSITIETVLLGETGKLHNNVLAGYRENEVSYTGDLEVRGNWIDKAFAMEYLLNQDLLTTAGASLHLSFANHKGFRAEIDNLMKHLTYGAPLENPTLFTAIDGSRYHAPFETSLNIETKVPKIKSILKQFIPFPDTDNFNMGSVLVKVASKTSFSAASDSQDHRELKKRREFHNSLQVWGKNRTASELTFGDLIIAQVDLPNATYGATKENILALDLITRIDGGQGKSLELIQIIKEKLDVEEKERLLAELLAKEEAAARAQDLSGEETEADATQDDSDAKEEEPTPAPAAEITAGLDTIERVIALEIDYNNAKNDVDALIEIVMTTTKKEQASERNERIDILLKKIGTTRFNNTVTIFNKKFAQFVSELETELRSFDLYDLQFFMLTEKERIEEIVKLENGLINL